MKKITNILLIFIMGLLAIVPFTKVAADDKASVNVYLFYGDGCPHCEAAMTFFDSIEEEYGHMFDLVKYEVWNDSGNAALMEEVGTVFNQTITGVPFIVIGDKTFAGYSSSSNESIIAAIQELYDSETRYDVVENENLLTESSSSSTTVYIVLGIIVIAIVCILGFSKAKAN